MEVDDPMTVYTVNNPYEAEDIKTALQGQGISCQLNGDGQAGLSDSLEVSVLVRPRDADRALTIIQQNEAHRQKQTTRRHAENHHPEK
jgi:type III secretory pathway lipoprotein EscJ